MAIRLSKVLGRNPESGLTTQDNYDLWRVKHVNALKHVLPIDFLQFNKTTN